MDVASRQVLVQMDWREETLVEALRPHDLTLQNYASITEQQVGAFA